MRNLVSSLLFVSLVFLAGCGQKGPLYFPEETNVERHEAQQLKDEGSSILDASSSEGSTLIPIFDETKTAQDEG